MACYKPLKGYVGKEFTKNGLRPLVFDKRAALADGIFERVVPCGQCIGCRLEYSRQWAMRVVHEASMYKDNCFITLTYDDAHLPSNLSLDKSHFVLFIKRFRDYLYRQELKRLLAQTEFNSIRKAPLWLRKLAVKNTRIRYFYCGEYGDKYGRPHFHAIIFNYDFSDKVMFKNLGEHKLFVSPLLQSLWRYGYSSIGSVTFESAAYVARYVTKKIVGKDAHSHYASYCDLLTGEVVSRVSEYADMSRVPGIGSVWYDKFKHTDCYNNDFVVFNGKKMRPPKYYDSKYGLEFPELFQEIKRKRLAAIDYDSDDNSYERLIVREKCKILQVEKLLRNLDKDFV